MGRWREQWRRLPFKAMDHGHVGCQHRPPLPHARPSRPPRRSGPPRRWSHSPAHG